VILSCILAGKYTCIERDNRTDLYIPVSIFLHKSWQDTFFDSNIKSYYPRDTISLCRVRLYIYMNIHIR